MVISLGVTVLADCFLIPLQRDHREPLEPLAALTDVDGERVVAHADSDSHGGHSQVLSNAAGSAGAAQAARETCGRVWGVA